MFTIYDLYEKQRKEVEDFKNNCKHKYEDGTSALKRYIDDEDVEDDKGNIYHEATYEEWEECRICGMVRDLQ
jgi:hypothetical protein